MRHLRYHLVLVVTTCLTIAACSDPATAPSGTSDDDPFPIFPRQFELDSVHFTAELDTRFLPPATPTSEFNPLVWHARNTTPRTITLEYCWLGIRMYRGSTIVWEAPTFGHCLLSISENVVPDGESTIGTGGGPELYLRQGVPEGRFLLTVRWQLSGMADTLEMRVGEVELRENNGLTPPEEPGAETRLFVSGRSRNASGDAVRGWVGVRVHWDDCDRFPVVWDVITTDVTGHFEQEVTLQEGIFNACVTVLVEPFEEQQGTSKVAEVGRLRLRKPAASGAPRDSLRVEVVF